MEKVAGEKENASLPPVSNSSEAIRHFRQGLAGGKHWYIALLEAIGLWTDDVENINGVEYRYLIENEAFDWISLAQRLCDAMDGLIPEDERYAFIFQGKPPLELDSEQFKRLIGELKYHQFLNFFYGVTVEDALVQAVREEVRKERSANCLSSHKGEDEEAYIRIYGETEADLFKHFRKSRRHHLQTPSNLTEIKEFIYWRFKLRVKTAEKARVASDTHKALEWLRNHGLHYPC
jgi:hypothetical protein